MTGVQTCALPIYGVILELSACKASSSEGTSSAPSFVSESRDHRHEISFSLVVIQRLHNHLSASHAFSTCLLCNSLLSQMINYDAELGGCLGRYPRAIFCKRPATQEGDGFDEPQSRFQCVVSVHASSPDFLRPYAFFCSYERTIKSSKSRTACAAY